MRHQESPLESVKYLLLSPILILDGFRFLALVYRENRNHSAKIYSEF